MGTRTPIHALVDPLLHRKVKLACVIKDRQMADVISEALAQWLERNPASLDDFSSTPPKPRLRKQQPATATPEGSPVGA